MQNFFATKLCTYFFGNSSLSVLIDGRVCRALSSKEVEFKMYAMTSFLGIF